MLPTRRRKASPEPFLAAFGPRWARRLSYRLCLIFLLCRLALTLPFPADELWLSVRNVVVAGMLVGLTGKTLYDTLFYDRFLP